MKVLVTGGCGFIGRILVTRLTELGHRIVILDRRDPVQVGLSFDGEVANVVGDIRDPEAINRAFTGDIEAVIHLAAVTSVLKSKLDPDETFYTNLFATHLLLERARQLDTKIFVMASTNAVAGSVGENLISELTPLNPLTPYGATKAAAEMLMSAYTDFTGLKCCPVRLTNVYGPGMGEKDSFIPRLIRAALAQDEITIYGDGLQVRDFVSVHDAVAGLIMPLSGDICGPLTIGSGTSISVLDLHRAVCEVTKRNIQIVHGPEQAGEMRAVRVDISRARTFGFEPRVSLTDGLAETFRDFQLRTGPKN